MRPHRSGGGTAARRGGWQEHERDALELALRGDVEAVRTIVRDPDSGVRARALDRALSGDEAGALRLLAAGDAGEWPTPLRLAVDLAAVRLLAGSAEGAFAALELGLRGSEQLPPVAARLLTECVRRAPRLRRAALRLALTSGSLRQRAAAAALLAAVSSRG